MSSRSKSVRVMLHLAAMLAVLPAWRVATAEVVEEGEGAVVDEDTDEEEEKSGPGSRFSGTIQFDFTNAYFFRGIMNERSSFIFQPFAELNLDLYSSDTGPIRDVTAGVGVWNSVHEKKTGAEHSPSSLYETDWYPMLSFGLPGGVTFTGTYYWYTSPNGAFDTVQELDLEFSWDDGEYLGRFALSPFVNWAIETDRTSLGDNKGTGVQFGVEPTLFLLPFEKFPVTFTAPVEVGLSVDDYYEDDDGNDDTFGYISYGVKGTLPLEFVDKSYGAWSLIVSGNGLHLGNNLANVNRNDDDFGIVTGSLAVEF